MLHLDIPTPERFLLLSQTRAEACVSIYLPTTSLSQHADADRIQLGNLLKIALGQLENANVDKRQRTAIQEHVEDLIDDDDFWRFQANSLAVLTTPEQIRTFRLATGLPSPVAQPALRRHTSKVGAGCGNAARPVLCGGCPVMDIPTAIGSTVLKSRNRSAGAPGCRI
jgi:hypothetical protein